MFRGQWNFQNARPNWQKVASSHNGNIYFTILCVSGIKKNKQYLVL
jgi:hypothetical protein